VKSSCGFILYFGWLKVVINAGEEAYRNSGQHYGDKGDTDDAVQLMQFLACQPTLRKAKVEQTVEAAKQNNCHQHDSIDHFHAPEARESAYQTFALFLSETIAV
jgi:hypothetical protein